MSSVIIIENLHYTYPGDDAESLKGVSLEIERGSFTVILGHNGSDAKNPCAYARTNASTVSEMIAP